MAGGPTADLHCPRHGQAVPRIKPLRIAGGLGAVFRTVLETMRTLFVWLVDLLLFYTPLGLGKLGESWSAWSFVQAAGCASYASLSLSQCPA